MKIRIYVMTHKKFEMPQSPLFRPLHVGRACGEDLGYPGDDTGENISDKNCYYSELTGLYVGDGKLSRCGLCGHLSLPEISARGG